MSCSGNGSCPSAKTCSMTCPKPCTVTCPMTCPKPCPVTCPMSCPMPCPGTCPKPCPMTCTKPCYMSCPKPCPMSCPKPCPVSCPKPCPVSCPKPCPVSCPKPCPVSCPKPCPVTCPMSFPKPCPETCPMSCPGSCPMPCPMTCTKPCYMSCPKPCPVSCHKPCPVSCPKPCPVSCPKPCPMSCPMSCPKPCPMPCSRPANPPSRCGAMASCGRKANSVYGCGSGGRTRISSCSSRRSGCGSGGCNDYLRQNDKATMQNLNDRLASYLDKVQSLETANCNLERQIREHLEKKGPIGQRDFSCYWNTIKCLQEQIRDATSCNAYILLQVDNSSLAADDFRMKYENELMMRQSVEADICNLRCLLDKTTHARSDLEMQFCSLQDELACLKKNHKEDVAALMSQLSGTVCVEVNAAPQQDLNKVLNEIRCHYEAIIEKHRKDQEAWFNQKTAELCQTVASNTECIESSKSQITDLRRTIQCLEIDLQSQMSMKSALECSLTETQSRYSTMLAGFQNQINTLEAELCQVRAGIEQQGRDYAVLLNIKSCLEQEIATYRCLLENQDNKTQVPGGSPKVCSSPAICKPQC